jgi:hypothetical protein
MRFALFAIRPSVLDGGPRFKALRGPRPADPGHLPAGVIRLRTRGRTGGAEALGAMASASPIGGFAGVVSWASLGRPFAVDALSVGSLRRSFADGAVSVGGLRGRFATGALSVGGLRRPFTTGALSWGGLRGPLATVGRPYLLASRTGLCANRGAQANRFARPPGIGRGAARGAGGVPCKRKFHSVATLAPAGRAYMAVGHRGARARVTEIGGDRGTGHHEARKDDRKRKPLRQRGSPRGSHRVPAMSSSTQLT